MPSFYPRTFPRHLPLTPPGMNPGYSSGHCEKMQISSMGYVPVSMPAHTGRPKIGFDYTDNYGPRTAFPTPGSVVYHPQPIAPPNYGTVAPVPHSSQLYPDFGPIAAPILPPIRVHEPSSFDRRGSGQNQDAHANAKSEKAVGGVAAHLDYEMEQMIDFVAETAQRLVQPNTSVSPSFRKYVSQILSSTRLPSSTIFLGFYYLASRMESLSSHGRYEASSGQLYRMLTIALLLGSKFLDDNTFQNRSWSDVTGLPLKEINTLEAEWLVAIEWTLHVDPHERNGLLSWRDHWAEWKNRASRSTDSMKLAPLDTNVARQASQAKPFAHSPYSTTFNSPMHQAQPLYHGPVHYDRHGWGFARRAIDYSPPSAPETGPSTPEYYAAPGPWNRGPQYSGRQLGSIPPQTPYHNTNFQYAPSIWNVHGAACGCTDCARQHSSYFLNSGFGPQPVAG